MIEPLFPIENDYQFYKSKIQQINNFYKEVKKTIN
ncbi:hypothetical protein BH10BAC1_BH10BAC1_18620 [soil metagenome]